MDCRNEIEPWKVVRPASRIGVGPSSSEASSGVMLNVKGEQLPMWHMSG
jgi:hypothetical protein